MTYKTNGCHLLAMFFFAQDSKYMFFYLIVKFFHNFILCRTMNFTQQRENHTWAEGVTETKTPWPITWGRAIYSSGVHCEQVRKCATWVPVLFVNEKQAGEERVHSGYTSALLFITKESQDGNSHSAGNCMIDLRPQLWVNVASNGLLSQLSYKTQDHQSRDEAAQKGWAN